MKREIQVKSAESSPGLHPRFQIQREASAFSAAFVVICYTKTIMS